MVSACCIDSRGENYDKDLIEGRFLRQPTAITGTDHHEGKEGHETAQTDLEEG